MDKLSSSLRELDVEITVGQFVGVVHSTGAVEEIVQWEYSIVRAMIGPGQFRIVLFREVSL